MRPLLALAFLALAQAAFIEVPETTIHGDYRIDPKWTSGMFTKYGLTKPLFEDFSTWGKSIGVEDPVVLKHMHSFYDKPSLVFFQDPSGRVVSYFAHEGIDKPFVIPEVRSALHGLYGAADKMAINFRPDNMLGHYKTVLPGHFFEPMNKFDLPHIMNDMTEPIDARWANTFYNKINQQQNLKSLWKTIDINDLPMMYKDPVALNIEKKILSDDIVPFTHVSPITGFSDVSAAVPFGFGRSEIIPGASHFVSGMPFTKFSDVSAAVPFGFGRSDIIPGSSHFVSGMPFTKFSDVSAALPFGHGRSDILPSHLISGMPLTKFSDVSANILFGYGRSGIVPGVSHLVSGMPFTGFSDISADMPFGYARSSLIPGAAHFTSAMPFAGFRSALGVTPAVKSAAYHLVKADLPYFTAAPTAGFVDSASAGFPLFKSAAPLFTAEPAGLSAGGFSPVHALAAPPTTHYVATPLAKSGVPCINCLGAEHSFAPAGAYPLVKTFGDVGLTHLAAADAYKSVIPGLTAEPTFASPNFVKAVPVTSSLFGTPSVGLTGLAGVPIVA